MAEIHKNITSYIVKGTNNYDAHVIINSCDSFVSITDKHIWALDARYLKSLKPKVDEYCQMTQEDIINLSESERQEMVDYMEKFVNGCKVIDSLRYILPGDTLYKVYKCDYTICRKGQNQPLDYTGLFVFDNDGNVVYECPLSRYRSISRFKSTPDYVIFLYDVHRFGKMTYIKDYLNY